MNKTINQMLDYLLLNFPISSLDDNNSIKLFYTGLIEIKSMYNGLYIPPNAIQYQFNNLIETK